MEMTYTYLTAYVSDGDMLLEMSFDINQMAGSLERLHEDMRILLVGIFFAFLLLCMFQFFNYRKLRKIEKEGKQ